jgi:hypothetical protein
MLGETLQDLSRGHLGLDRILLDVLEEIRHPVHNFVGALAKLLAIHGFPFSSFARQCGLKAEPGQ